MEEKASFEKNMTRLEEVVKKLESGTGPLEEMLSLYEEGMKLHDACEKQLNEYEGKLQKLSAKEAEA